MLRAKTILENKFWLVEKNGVKFATLRKQDDRYVFSNEDGVVHFKNLQHIYSELGKDFFMPFEKVQETEDHNVHGYPSSCKPYNKIFDVKRKLPLFTKSKDSKSLFSAGYYIIKFDKGWVKSFCPKLITLQRYDHQGPFTTELEMKQVLSNVNK